MLLHTDLIPNYVVRSLIEEWCKSNGVELPKRSGSSRSGNASGSTSDNSGDRQSVQVLLQKLSSGSLEDQRTAAGELCFLAKTNADNMICIAEGGAIPLLVDLLSTPDATTLEHVVTTLLNLSISENNKDAIFWQEQLVPLLRF